MSVKGQRVLIRKYIKAKSFIPSVEDDPMSPLPVETQLHSVSNSPADTPTPEDGRSCSPEDTAYWEPDDRRRARIRDASLLGSDYSPEPLASEKRAREYHR